MPCAITSVHARPVSRGVLILEPLQSLGSFGAKAAVCLMSKHQEGVHGVEVAQVLTPGVIKINVSRVLGFIAVETQDCVQLSTCVIDNGLLELSQSVITWCLEKGL